MLRNNRWKLKNLNLKEINIERQEEEPHIS